MYELVSERADAAARVAVDAGLRVHKELGPGLLPSVYQLCLAYELSKRETPHARDVAIPVHYDGIDLNTGFRADLIVDDSVIVVIKAVEALAPVHEAQTLTYLKLSGLRLALLINFNVPLFKQGVRRFVR